MAESMAYLANLAVQPIANIAATTTFSASSFGIGYLSSDLKEVIELVQDDMIRGTRSRGVERVALGNQIVQGSITFQPNVAELETLMPYILGTASSGGSYVVADALPFCYWLQDLVAKVATWTTKVSRATFSCRSGEKLTVKLDLVGTVMSLGAAGTYASASIPIINQSTRPYMAYDSGSGITINSITYGIDEFELIIDNKIVPTFMIGSQTATDVEPTDRVINLNIRTKYTSTETAIQTDTRAGTPRAASIAFTAGGNTFSFTMADIMATAESVSVENRQARLRLPLRYQVYAITTTAPGTKEIVVSLPA